MPVIALQNMNGADN